RWGPGGPRYGCAASHPQRAVTTDNAPPPDYAAPGGPIQEATVPAGIAAVHAVASLHALVTLAALSDALGGPAAGRGKEDPKGVTGFTSLLLTLQRVPDVFEEAFRPYRFRVARRADCLICQAPPATASPEDLDVALNQ